MSIDKVALITSFCYVLGLNKKGGGAGYTTHTPWDENVGYPL